MNKSHSHTVCLLNPPGAHRFLRDCHCGSIDKAGYYWSPLDLVMQSGQLAKSFRVELIDAIVQNLSPEQTLQRIKAFNPLAVLSLTSGLSWHEDKKLLRQIKETAGAKVFCSGDLALFQTVPLLEKAPWLDGALLDVASADLTVGLESGAFLPEGSVAYRDGDRIVAGKVPEKKTFQYPVPLHDRFFALPYRFPFALSEPVASILTVYGCPFRCGYCNTSMLRFSVRKSENIEQELGFLASSGVSSIMFRDATFNISKAHVSNMCRLLESRSVKFEWFAYARADTLDEEQVAQMAEAGCRFLGFGIESGSALILDEHKDRGVLQNTIATLSACRRHGIESLGHFVLGLPGESHESLKQTTQLLKTIPLDYASINLFEPRSGAPLLGDVSTIEHWKKKTKENVLKPDSYAEGLTCEELLKARAKMIRTFYLRPEYLYQRILRVKDFSTFYKYARQGLRLLINNLWPQKTLPK